MVKINKKLKENNQSLAKFLKNNPYLIYPDHTGYINLIKIINPHDLRPIILELDAALWLIKNQEKLVECCCSDSEKRTFIRLVDIEIPQDAVPKSLIKYLCSSIPIPVEKGSVHPFLGRWKFKGRLSLTRHGVKSWNKLKEAHPEYPNLVNNNEIDIDELIKNVSLGRPCSKEIRIKNNLQEYNTNFKVDLSLKKPAIKSIIGDNSVVEDLIGNILKRYSVKNGYRKYGVFYSPKENEDQ